MPTSSETYPSSYPTSVRLLACLCNSLILLVSPGGVEPPSSPVKENRIAPWGGDATGLPSGVNHTGTGVFYALGFWVSMGRRFRWAVLRVCGTRTPHTHLVASTSCCLWPPTIGFGPQRGIDSTHPVSSSGTAFVSKPGYNWGPPAPASIGVDLVPHAANSRHQRSATYVMLAKNVSPPARRAGMEKRGGVSSGNQKSPKAAVSR